jgi:uncharacterized membrane protein YdbT with pleckstrin-like domain
VTTAQVTSRLSSIFINKNNHMQNSTTPYTASLHWIIFFWPTVVCITGIVLLCTLPVFLAPGLLFSIFGLIWFLVSAVTYHFSSLVITDKQLILTTGFLVRQSVNIPIVKIESIDIRQPILGSLINYGSLFITGTGGTKYSIHSLHHPLTCRRKIEQLIGHA